MKTSNTKLYTFQGILTKEQNILYFLFHKYNLYVILDLDLDIYDKKPHLKQIKMGDPYPLLSYENDEILPEKYWKSSLTLQWNGEGFELGLGSVLCDTCSYTLLCRAFCPTFWEFFSSVYIHVHNWSGYRGVCLHCGLFSICCFLCGCVRVSCYYYYS